MLLSENELYLKSINGMSLLSETLVPYVRDIDDPDMEICYTLPRNFSARFKVGSKLKLAIYNYETSLLPEAWHDSHKFIDYALPSSNFSKEIFVNAGWPESKCIVVPHGINLTEYENKSKYKLINKNTFRFLNISIPHYRKNIDILLEAYYSAFTSNDDVCLVLKTNFNDPNPKNKFEVDVKKVIHDAQQKFVRMGRSNLPMLEVVRDRLDDMVPLYNSCDALISTSSSEGFGLPLLEGLAAGIIVIAPNCSGQLDFLNNNNSILTDYKEILAGPKYEYWRTTPGSKTYIPLVDSVAQNMLDVFKNHKQINKRLSDARAETARKFTWENVSKQILEIS
jgi:glycosyltransferase involved in cell wall biosynthesis